MKNYRFWAILIVFGSIVLGYFVWSTENADSKYKFKLGLDLSGGTHLAYRADVSKVQDGDISGAMSTLRDTIERRINLFGVSEPLVQTEEGGLLDNQAEHKLIVELPGVTDVGEAIKQIGKTPSLDFRLLSKEKAALGSDKVSTSDFVPTGLDGSLLKKANLQFDANGGSRPVVGIEFNDQGKDLFAKITREHSGDVLGIFLDGNLIQAPSIKEEIPDGKAVITGDFSVEEAKNVIRDLNFGALPVPIELIGTQSVGATLGSKAVDQSVQAGMYAFIIISIFLVVWYRGPGLVSILALAIYTVINLALFKFIPVTLTSAGIAGFILSIGMAVDANILIFERTKEELKRGKSKNDAIHEGFARAWTSIRDSNLSSIITAIILYYFASNSIVKGFALVFFIGVIVSMFSAITASRTVMFAFNPKK